MPANLRAADPAECVAAMAALLDRPEAPGADDLDALGACLGDARKLIQRRAAETCAALVARGVRLEDRLHAGLAATDLRLRWGAAYALSLLGAVPPSALPTLLEVMGLDDGDLRWAAADLVKQLCARHRPAVVAHLLAAAQAPGAPRKMALYCLRDLGVSEAADVALAALGDPAIDTRLAALATLAVVGADRDDTARRVVGLLDDPDARMRRAAAAALGSLRRTGPTVRAALERAASSADAALRRAAERSLRLLGPPR